eukprot:600044-Hanusia_phi.AAC.4
MDQILRYVTSFRSFPPPPSCSSIFPASVNLPQSAHSSQAIKDLIIKLQDDIEIPPSDQQQEQQQGDSWKEEIERQLEDSRRSWRSGVVNTMSVLDPGSGPAVSDDPCRKRSRAGKLALTDPVMTDCGRVKGLKETKLRVFKGIPYAKPPT